MEASGFVPLSADISEKPFPLQMSCLRRDRNGMIRLQAQTAELVPGPYSKRICYRPGTDFQRRRIC